MEGVVKQWKVEEEEAEVEEAGLFRREAHQPVTAISITSSSHIDVQGQEISETEDIEKKSTTLPSSDTVMSRDLTSLHNVTIESEKRQEISETKDNPSSSDIEKKKIITLPSSDIVVSRDLTSPNNVTTESERVGVITGNIQAAKELYLESLYQKPHTQGFYCPKCRACIDRVLILDPVRQEPDAPPPPPPEPFERFRCPTCFSFLELGRWLVPCWDWAGKKAPDDVPPASSGQELQPEPKTPYDPSKTQDPPHKAIDIPGEQSPDVSTAKPPRWGLLAGAIAIATRKKPREAIPEVRGQEPSGSTTPAPANTTPAVQEAGSSKTWDILKSIVYGGLVESIASLGIVASSASADATTLSILALSLANLVGGLFILVHHIWDLKSEKPSTNEIVDRYYLSLGKRDNFYLHVCIAILSFLIFGLVPPLVYGLTFYETNYKDLALVAVAGASIICITLLSIAKVSIQRPNTYLTYLKTVLYYLCTGALTSIITYLVGVLIRKLLEKLGLSSESSLSFNLMLPQMSVTEKPRFGSY